jgi:hypothetical protein
MPQRIAESGKVAAKPSSGGNMLIQLITPGEGSSGVYSAEVLEAAATDAVFPAGTLMFADHPGETESYDRPERSIRDVAGVLVEDARWDGGALVAEAKTYAPWTEVLAEMHDSIGVSIRAYAEHGEAKPGKRPTVSRLVEGISVDFVTKAGRGGAIRQVYESARSRATLMVRDATDPTNLPVIREAATSQTSERLRELVRDTYKGDAKDIYVWVRDFDPEKGVVWFEVEGGNAPGIWQEGYTLDANEMPTLSGDRFEVVQRTEYVPVTAAAAESGTTTVPAPAGQPHPTHSSKEDTMGNIQVDEAQHASLTEAAGRVPTLESERDTEKQRADVAERKLRDRDNTDAAREVIATESKDAGVTFTALESRGLIAEMPLDDNGDLDKAKFGEAVKTAAAEKAQESGAGTITGFGSTRTTTDTDVIAEAEKAAAGAFGRQTSQEG